MAADWVFAEEIGLGVSIWVVIWIFLGDVVLFCEGCQMTEESAESHKGNVFVSRVYSRRIRPHSNVICHFLGGMRYFSVSKLFETAVNSGDRANSVLSVLVLTCFPKSSSIDRILRKNPSFQLFLL